MCSPCRGGDGLCVRFGDLDSPRPPAPVDDPMMSIENLAGGGSAAAAGASDRDRREKGDADGL